MILECVDFPAYAIPDYDERDVELASGKPEAFDFWPIEEAPEEPEEIADRYQIKFDMTFEDIGRALGISRKAAEHHCKRGLFKLQQVVAFNDGHPINQIMTPKGELMRKLRLYINRHRENLGKKILPPEFAA